MVDEATKTITATNVMAASLISSNNTQMILSILGTLLSFALYLSPFQSLRNAVSVYANNNNNNNSSNNSNIIINSNSMVQRPASPLPYLAMFINCLLWVTYGVLCDNFTLVLVNFVGFLFASYYNYLYFRITNHRDSFLTQCSIALLFYLLSMVYVMFALNDHEQEVRQLGYLAAMCSILMFGSPLASVREVVQKRDAQSIPLLMSLAGTGCSLVWALYGFSLGDSSIVVPNAIGAVLGVFQLSLKWLYPGSASADDFLGRRRGSSPGYSLLPDGPLK